MSITENQLQRTHIYNNGAPKIHYTPIAQEELKNLLNICAQFQTILPQYTEACKYLNKIVPTFEGMQRGLNIVMDRINRGEEVNIVFLEEFTGYLSENFLGVILKVLQQGQNYAGLKDEKNNDNTKKRLLVSYMNQNLLQIRLKGQVLRLLNKFEISEKINVNYDDILQQPQKGGWDVLDRFIEYRLIFKDQKAMEKQLYSFLGLVSITNAVCYKTKDMTDGISKSIYECLYTVYFRLLRSQSFKTMHEFLADDDQQTQIDTAIRVWNGLDNMPTMRFWVGSTLPGVKYHQKLYFHRCFEELTLEKVLEWQNNENLNVPEKLGLREPEDRNIWKKTNKNDKVKVRVLCNTPLIRKDEQCQEQGFLGKIFGNLLGFNNQQQQNKVHDKVIIHIHGGGWVSMSSFSHQCYSRRWTKNPELKDVPIISVDYRKSPKWGYPCALEDVFQVYLFTLYQLKNYYNIDPKKIILFGDSAGGNLCLGICQLCVKYNVPMPDGVMLAYPAVNLSDKNYTPALNKAMVDIICPFQFLELCLNEYVRDKRSDTEKDSLLSPLFMKDELIQKLPPIRMMVGEDDCLKDDGIRFLNKLINNKKNAKLIMYKGLKHGFLNWDIPLAMPLTRACGSDAADLMVELLKI